MSVSLKKLTLSEVIHLKGLKLVKRIQLLAKGKEEMLMMWSHFGDPGNVFVLFFPAIFCLSNKWGIRLLWIGVMGEWLNLCLKWLIHGERPYWFAIEQRDSYGDYCIPYIKQFPMTCETGPGMPSGHAMITGSVWFLLVFAILKILQDQFWPHRNSCPTVLGALSWVAFTIAYVLVCLSRLLLAAHFPHQVLVGSVCGFTLLICISVVPVAKARMPVYVLTSTLLFAIAYGEYIWLHRLGLDPDWSVSKALKFCEDISWVHLNTAPLHTLARLCGALLGLGLGLGLRSLLGIEQYRLGYTADNKPHWPVRIVSAILAVLLYNFAESISLPQDPIEYFYLLAFVKHAIVPIVVVTLVPCVARLLIFMQPSFLQNKVHDS